MSDGRIDHEVSLLMVLAVVFFSLPGALFSLLLAADALVDLRRFARSELAGQLAAVSFVGGALGILTTPIAITCAWAGRRSLRTRTGVAGLVFAVVASLGWIAFVARYANPFFSGS